jgi:CRISPR-associated protein Csm1
VEEKILKLSVGGMLHDTGKVLYRGTDGRNHSQSGYDYLKDEIGLKDQDILDQVRYHHAKFLKNAELPDDSLAYITYMADNIAASADRRKGDSSESGFNRSAALESIFNHLNGEHGRMKYRPAALNRKEQIAYPTDEAISFDEEFYTRLRHTLTDVMKQVTDGEVIHQEYVNSLLEVLEANLSLVPSSTDQSEIADVSLFDHVKLTAAIGCCIFRYLSEQNITDYRNCLFASGRDFYDRPAFCLFSMDMSGIQSFIYQQYDTKTVLKNLRARSFYLDILMENLVDELLEMNGLCRANLIYCGGGHAYLLLPGTEQTEKILKTFQQITNQWIQKVFQADLFVACGYTFCTANELINRPEGSYQNLFRRVSRSVSRRKAQRYSADDIRYLNAAGHDSDGRECRICHRSDELDEDNCCCICSGLIRLSKGILQNEFFVVMDGSCGMEGMPLWDNRILIFADREATRRLIRDNPHYVRAYTKNDRYTGDMVAAKLWVGDYCREGKDTLEELVKNGKGIRRLGVLRADVDNLGQTFVAGFPPEYQTLSRAATFSRKMSLFFKRYINDILQNGSYSLDSGEKERNAAVVYSGGDDVFVVGAWKDIIEFAVDLSHDLERFSQGALTISAGFGMYEATYPIAYIASDTGALEDRSKQEPGKNAITLFADMPIEKEGSLKSTYPWKEFCDQVLGEKFRVICDYFSHTDEHGKALLYRVLELFRNRGERINLARLAYLSARMEPGKKASEEERESYRRFREKIYEWIQTPSDSSEVITALYLYSYLIREREEKEKDE